MDFRKLDRVLVVAELSANHLQDYELAKKSVIEIAKCGADAVKFQTYMPNTITLNCDNEYFKIKGTIWDGKNLYELYKEAYMPWEWQESLAKLADELGLIWFSSVVDKSGVDFLESLNCPIYKLPSFEITDIDLIEYIAKLQKPLILSSGIATLEDIELALNSCYKHNNHQVALLKCTSSYPCDPIDMNLKVIPHLSSLLGVTIGLSDHTLGIAVPVAAVALGAKIVEKHFILDRNLGGPDSAFSLEPDEFRAMVKSIREAEAALGDGVYKVSPKMQASRKFAKSLFVIADIKEGEEFNLQNIGSIRPGDGLAPKYLKELLGKKAKRDIKKGTPLSWELIL